MLPHQKKDIKIIIMVIHVYIFTRINASFSKFKKLNISINKEGIYGQATDESVQFALQDQLLIKTSTGAPSCSYLLLNGPPNKNASEQNVPLLKFLVF